MASRKLILGWGINDADYPVYSPRDEDGKRDVCPIYQCWRDMIKRCHCPKSQARCKTYVDCWVDERWCRFMVFRAWYLGQAPKSSDHLDKDFLGDGKLYSSETCCFMPQWLNNLFIDHVGERGSWPQGVCYHKQNGKYIAQITIKGKVVYIGSFDTPQEASEFYLEAKAAYVEELLAEFPQPPRLEAAVRRKMTELIEQETALWYANPKAKSRTPSRSSLKNGDGSLNLRMAT